MFDIKVDLREGDIEINVSISLAQLTPETQRGSERTLLVMIGPFFLTSDTARAVPRRVKNRRKNDLDTIKQPRIEFKVSDRTVRGRHLLNGDNLHMILYSRVPRGGNREYSRCNRNQRAEFIRTLDPDFTPHFFRTDHLRQIYAQYTTPGHYDELYVMR